MTFHPLGNSDHVVILVSIDFPINWKQDTPFHRLTYDYSCADWGELRDHLRHVPWKVMFKLFKLLLLLKNFVCGFGL